MECKQSLVAKLSHQLEHVIRISRTKPWTYKPNTTLCPDELFCSSSKASSLPLADPFPIPLFYTDKLSSTFPVRRRDRHYCLQLRVACFKLKTKQKGSAGEENRELDLEEWRGKWRSVVSLAAVLARVACRFLESI